MRAVFVAAVVACGVLGSPAQAGLFNSRFDDFKELADAGKAEEAAALYANEPAYFSALKGDKRTFVDDVMGRRDERYATALGEARVALMLAEAEQSPIRRWSQFKNGFEQARLVIASTERLPAPGPLTSDGLASLKAAVQTKAQALQAQAPRTLLEYGLFTEPPLPTQYPVTIRWIKEPALAARIEEQLRRASARQLERFRTAYGDTLVAALGLAPTLGDAYVSARIRESGARSYLTKQLMRERLAAQGWGQAGNADAGVLLAAWPAPKSEVSSYRLTPPTSAGYLVLDATQSPGNVLTSFAAAKRDAIVFVRPSPIRLERSESGVRQVSSRYRTGTRRVSNPAYAEAQRALAKARDDLADVQRAAANASSDADSSLAILAAVVSGVSQGAAETRVSDAERVLEDTPSLIDEPVFASYSYSARTVAVKQSVTSHYAIHDTGTGQTTTGTIDRIYEQTFSVAEGVRTDDPQHGEIMKKAKTPQDVETWINGELVDKSDALWAAVLADYKAKTLGI